LKPENITVVDMAGNILSEDIGSDEESRSQKLTVTQNQLQKQYQKEMQNSVQSMLERIVGIGKAVVRVQADLDFDKIQEKSELYGNNVVRSKQVNEETSKSTTTDNTGVPGTDSNIPGYVTGGGTGSSDKTTSGTITNYEVDKTETVKDIAPGSVKRLSVAVVIDKVIDAKQLGDIENAVKNATGFEQTRGDQISVAGMDFNTEYQDQLKSEIAKAEQRQQMMVYGGLAALALLIISGVVASIVIKKRRAKAEEAAVVGEFVTPLPVDEFISMEPVLSQEEKEQKRMKDQVEKVAKDHPDDIAQLLKTWLAEE